MALMLPPAVLQGEAPLEMSLLGSPQWGLHPGHPLQPRYRWLQKKLELGFALQLQLVEFLPLVASRLRELLGFEPALALEAPLLAQLLVELQKQLVLVLVLELQLMK